MADTDYAFNLTDMSTVDAAVLPCALGSADLVIVYWVNGDLKILKGEDAICADKTDLAVLKLLVANDAQMHIVVAALQLIDAGSMDQQTGLNFWTMLVRAMPTPNSMPQPRPVVAFAPDIATTYPDAAARGQVRLWKQQLAKQYHQFDRSYRNAATKVLLEAFTRKTGAGRRRAFSKLAQSFGPGVTLQGLRLDGHPLAVWSLLKPRDAVREAKDDHCVTVNYVLAGLVPDESDGLLAGVSEGLWSLEIFDHALGRAIERGGTSLTALVHEAHDNLLRLRAETILSAVDLAKVPSFLVRAGAGGFVCRAQSGSDRSTNFEPMFYIQARTWIADDMLHDDQVMLVADGQPGERLVDSWLLPRPVRRIVRSGKALVVSPWIEGLPELLVAPRGRA